MAKTTWAAESNDLGLINLGILKYWLIRTFVSVSAPMTLEIYMK